MIKKEKLIKVVVFFAVFVVVFAAMQKVTEL